MVVLCVICRRFRVIRFKAGSFACLLPCRVGCGQGRGAPDSFRLKVDNVWVNRRGIVQQVVVLVLEVFVEEREHAGSYRLALGPGSGGRISRPSLIADQRASVLKTLMCSALNLQPECIAGCLGEEGQGGIQPWTVAG